MVKVSLTQKLKELHKLHQMGLEARINLESPNLTKSEKQQQMLLYKHCSSKLTHGLNRIHKEFMPEKLWRVEINTPFIKSQVVYLTGEENDILRYLKIISLTIPKYREMGITSMKVIQTNLITL